MGLRSVIYEDQVWIVFKEHKDKEGHYLFITNKGLSSHTGWSRLIVNACDTSYTQWECSKFCEEQEIKWEGKDAEQPE